MGAKASVCVTKSGSCSRFVQLQKCNYKKKTKKKVHILVFLMSSLVSSKLRMQLLKKFAVKTAGCIVFVLL